MGAGPRVFRRRFQWCRSVRPDIPPCRVRHHTVMADGAYMGHDRRLIMAIDGGGGEVPGLRWRAPRTGWRAASARRSNACSSTAAACPGEHTRRAREWPCRMRSGSPGPASPIRMGRRNATGTAKPSGDDNGDDGGPGYGTGADRDESHTHVKRDQTDQKPKSKTPRLVPKIPRLVPITRYPAYMRKPRSVGVPTFSGDSPYVRVGGVEPPRAYTHCHLKTARLPFRHTRRQRDNLPAIRG